MFSSATYEVRRKTLESRFDSGMLIFLGNNESPKNYADNCYPFRQDSTFLYYFGLDQPSLAGVIDADSGEVTVFGDDLSIDMIVWMGSLPRLSVLGERVGVNNQKPLSALQDTIKDAVSGGRKIHFLPPYRMDNRLKLRDFLDVDFEKAEEHFKEAVSRSNRPCCLTPFEYGHSEVRELIEYSAP